MPDERITESTGTAILSPHPDDAALSLGGSLQLSIFPQPVTLITIFGRSNYVNGGFHPDWREATKTREAEDLAYATAMGLKHHYLRLPEAALRPERGVVHLFMQSFSVPIQWPDSLRASLQSILRSLQPKILIVPLGLGCHKDHLLVGRAAREQVRGQPWRLIYFEDLPYAAEISMRKIRNQAKTITPALSPVRVDISNVIESKVRALSAYRSQIGKKEVLAVRRHSQRVGKGRAQERLWMVTKKKCKSFS